MDDTKYEELYRNIIKLLLCELPQREHVLYNGRRFRVYWNLFKYGYRHLGKEIIHYKKHSSPLDKLFPEKSFVIYFGLGELVIQDWGKNKSKQEVKQ